MLKHKWNKTFFNLEAGKLFKNQHLLCVQEKNPSNTMKL